MNKNYLYFHKSWPFLSVCRHFDWKTLSHNILPPVCSGICFLSSTCQAWSCDPGLWCTSMRRPSVSVWREGVTSLPDTYLGPVGPAILHMTACSKPRWCPPEHVTGVCVCVSERVVTDRVNPFSANALILLEGWIYITKLALGEEPIEWSDPGVDTLSLTLAFS